MSALTLDEVREHLNLPLSGSDDDTELQRFVDAAESAIGARCGGLGVASRTERVRGRSRSLVLSTAPVASLTSVTPVGGGTEVQVPSLNLNEAAGVVEHLDGSAFPERFYDVVYQAGRTVSPPDLLLAAKELVRHLWLTQRGSAPGSPGALPDVDFDRSEVSFPFSFPRRVQELMAPYLLVDL